MQLVICWKENLSGRSDTLNITLNKLSTSTNIDVTNSERLDQYKNLVGWVSILPKVICSNQQAKTWLLSLQILETVQSIAAIHMLCLRVTKWINFFALSFLFVWICFHCAGCPFLKHGNYSSSPLSMVYLIVYKAMWSLIYQSWFKLVKAACVSHAQWWTEAKLAIVFTYFSPFFFFLFPFLLSLLLFTHFGELPCLKIRFLQYFGITRRNI